MHEKFLRWVLGVESRTPGYMIKEEIKKRKEGVGQEGGRGISRKRQERIVGENWLESA